MSTEEPVIEEIQSTEPEAVAPESGQGEAEGQVESTTPTYFDLSEYADKVTKVKVRGEELEVPVKELADGYMRQADYTRSKQELAEARRLWEDLNRNPEETIRNLAIRQLEQQAPQQVEEIPDDPIERRFWEQEQRIARFEQMELDRQVFREIQHLESKYGDAFNFEEVGRRAVERGSADLEATFLQMQGERAWAAQAAQRDEQTRRAAGDAAARAAAAEAGQLVGGSSALGGGAPLEDEDLTFAEIYRKAKAMHGYDGP